MDEGIGPALVPGVPRSRVRFQQLAERLQRARAVQEPPIGRMPGVQAGPCVPTGRMDQCGSLLASSCGTSYKVVGIATNRRRNKHHVQSNRKCVSEIDLPEPPCRFRHGVCASASLPRLVLAVLPLLLVALPAIIPGASAAEAAAVPTVEALAAVRGRTSSDARILARRIHLGETNELLVNEQRLDELAIEIDQVLMHIRNRYPEMTETAARSWFRPATLLLVVEGGLLNAIARRWNGAGDVPLTGFEEFDELNSTLGLQTWESMPLFAAVTMHFSESANLVAARQAYLAVDGVVSAEFDEYLGDGPDIAATSASGRWFVIMRKAWGDCPSGCLNSEASFFVVSHTHVDRVDRARAEGMTEFRGAVPPAEWPKWIE